MRNWIIALAIWAAFVAAAGGRYILDANRKTAIPQVLQSMFTQVQATELVSIPRRRDGAVAGYDMVKARYAVNAAIRDPDATPIKPVIIDAMHAYFYDGESDPDDVKALTASIETAVGDAFGADMLQDLKVTSRFSALAR